MWRKRKSRARGRLTFVRSRRTTNRLQLRATSTVIFELTSPSSDVTSVAWFEETKLWRWRARVNESGATQQLDTVVLSCRLVSSRVVCSFLRCEIQDARLRWINDDNEWLCGTLSHSLQRSAAHAYCFTLLLSGNRKADIASLQTVKYYRMIQEVGRISSRFTRHSSSTVRWQQLGWIVTLCFL